MASSKPIRHAYNFKDVSGQKFGRLTALEHIADRKWKCRCDCGKEVIVSKVHLGNGHTKSCGCLSKEVTSKRSKNAAIHGMCNSSEYQSWQSMLERCYNERNHNFPKYGGAGITVCDHWKTSFVNFLADMGLKPTPKHTIDRIDGKSGYCPENCRWATPLEQANNRQNNRRFCFLGITHSIREWSEITGISYSILWNRSKNQWSAQRALLTPPDLRKSRSTLQKGQGHRPL